MNDRRVRQLLFELQHLRAAALQSVDERVAPLVVLGKQQREVGREALAQPHIVPVALGHRIAEPLVRDLVDDRAAAGADALLAVEDRARVLGAAGEAGGLHVGELLVRVRPDAASMKNCIARRDVSSNSAEPGLAILREHPRLDRHAVDGAREVRREPRDRDRVEPRGDRHRLLPVRAPHVVRQVELFDQQAVGDDLVVIRRRDDELAGGLVVRVIDHRQPVANQVRPVLAEEGALAVHVRADAQARGRRAAIADREGELLAGLRQRRQHDVQPVVGVREREVVRRRPRHVDWTAAPHRLHGHPGRHRHRGQIEIELGDPVAQELHRHRRLAGDLARWRRSGPA